MTTKIPEKLNTLALKAFSHQQMSELFNKSFKESKKEIENYLKNNDDEFDCTAGKGVTTDHGMIIYSEREEQEIDKDALIELVKNGIISVEILVSAGNFPAGKISEILPSKYIEKIIKNTGEKSISITMRANPEFKSFIEEKFSKSFNFDFNFEEPNLQKKEEEKEESKALVSAQKRLSKKSDI
jgi:hypothetical protein